MNNILTLLKSIIFHIIVVVVVSGAFLFKDDDVIITETPIQISFVNEVDTQKKPDIKKPKPVKDIPPPIKDDKPQPAPKALEQPKPKKAEIAKKEAEVEKTEEVKKAEVAPPIKAPKKPVSKPKPPKPKKTPKKLKPVKDKVEKKETTTGFASVLKNLADTTPTDTTRSGPKLTQTPTTDRMTTGELDAFRMQLSGCWNILPGAAQAETLAVNLTINMNRDRTVRNVQITDKSRYQTDTFFRAAADNAIRAIKHPDCTPLDLPNDKYNTWKTITLNFDPQTMF